MIRDPLCGSFKQSNGKTVPPYKKLVPWFKNERQLTDLENKEK